MNRSHTLGALDEDDMKKKLTAAEKNAHELERGNTAFRAANEKLAAELADERVRVGHLDETNRSLKDGLEARDNLLGEFLEHSDGIAALAARVRKLVTSRRTP
jgi:multidrug resistance efflux pump